jgi:hypothetical protein
MASYKSKIEGDHIILYDDSESMIDINIYVKNLSLASLEKKNKKAKYHKDRVNNLYKEWDKVKDKILNQVINK